MSGASIDLGSLCVVVVVVVCSWGISLLLSITCWNSYTRSRPQHIYCTQCSSLQYPAQPPQQQHYECEYPSYVLPPQYSYNPGLPHTADRLGILQSGEQPALLAPVLQSSRGSYTAYYRGDALGGLEPVELVSTRMELDRDSTISRSFTSWREPTPVGLHAASLKRRTSASSTIKENSLTQNERPAGVIDSVQEDANVSSKSITSVCSKLSQVRIFTSEPQNEQFLSGSVVSTTPRNAMRVTRKSMLSNISKRSVRSLIGANSSKHIQPKNEKSGWDRRQGQVVVEQGVLTSETNIETSDEEVFLSHEAQTGLDDIELKTPTPEKPLRSISQEKVYKHKTIQFSQDQVIKFPQSHLSVPKPHLVALSQGTSGGRDWSNPRKERQVGSPGNTANAEYFTKQHTPQLVDIDLDRSAGGEFRSECVANRIYKKMQSSRIADQLGCQLVRRGRKTYQPGYSESDYITSQSEDETRREAWDRRGKLYLPPSGPSPGYDLTPPVLDLSQVIPGNAASLPQLPTTSALSSEPSPLYQYSSVSFSTSDMSLVVSPTRPPSSLPQYLSSESSHPVSLDWDNYASDPQFQKNPIGEFLEDES